MTNKFGNLGSSLPQRQQFNMVLLTLVFSLLVSISSWGVLCCEEECMAGITKAFIRKYSEPISQVFLQLGAEVSNTFSPDDEISQDYLEPINKTLYLTAHNSYSNAMFPSYFHGKCQNPVTGINPSGCPNPSCRVVCGTPGSLVYHYPKLRMIVHDAVKSNYDNVTDPTSGAFADALSRLLRAMKSKNMLRPPLRFPSTFDTGTYGIQDEGSVNRTFIGILDKFSGLLDNQCGGYQKDPAANFPSCDWEREMIPYILTFP